MGQSFSEPVTALGHWALGNLSEIDAAREASDKNAGSQVSYSWNLYTSGKADLRTLGSTAALSCIPTFQPTKMLRDARVAALAGRTAAS